MSVRGFGLQLFASEQWGGATYIQILTAAALALTVSTIGLTPRQWWGALLVMCALSIVPALAELAYTLTHGRLIRQYLFMSYDPMSIQSRLLLETGRGILRFQTAMFATFPFFLAAMQWRLARGLRPALLSLAALLVALVTAGISGHRIALLSILVFFVVASLLERRRRPALFLIRVAAAGLGVLVVAMLVARLLPLSFQRALAVIPFADVSLEARLDAEMTSIWRVEIWKLLLREIPDHLWIGKGFVFSPRDLASLNYAPGAAMQNFIVSHNYHNGPLTLLIDTGIPGLAFGTLFMVATIVVHYRHVRDPWNDRLLAGLHRLMLAWFISRTLIFFFAFGDARGLVEFFFVCALMEGLRLSDRRLAPAPAPAARPAGLAEPP
jgi:hypothetical protein